MCSGPARVAGLEDRKGSIAPGLDADFVIFDPQGRFAITPEMIQHRHKVTPYAGEELRGVVKTTWLRGRKVWEDGKPIGNPAGQWIRR